ncbi:MAG: hypothetical protein AAGB93_15485 [Planctomycetota bacterium]
MRLALALALVAALLGALWAATRPVPRPPSVGVAGPPVPVVAPAPSASRAAREGARSELSNAPATVEPSADESVAVGAVDVHVTHAAGASGDRLPRAACAVELRALGLKGAETPIDAGTTGADGIWRYRGTATAPAGARVLARVVEPGHVQRTAYARTVDDASALRAWLVAERGGTVRGRVVDEAGRGLDGQVGLWRWTSKGGQRVFERRFRARSWRDGWFDLHVLEAEVDEVDGIVRGTLVAEIDGVGSGTLPDQAWDLGEPPRDLVVVARGAGVLAGTIRDANGDPASGLPIRAKLASVAESNEYALTSDVVGAALAGADGNVQGAAVTRADGSFEIAGLRTGRYHVWTRSTPWIFTSAYDVPVTGSPVSTGPDPVELTFTRTHLVVELKDADGRPWTGEQLQLRGFYSARSLPSTWSERVFVHVVPAVRGGDGWIARELGHLSTVEGTPTGDGATAFEVEAGSDYLVSVVGRAGEGAAFDGVPRHVRVPTGAGRHVEVVRASVVGPLGTLEIDVTVERQDRSVGSGEWGEANGPRERVAYTTAGSSVLVIEEERSGLPLLGAPRSVLPASPYRFDLPAGRYRVVARQDLVRPYSTFDPRHGGASRLVEVRAGETTHASLHVGPGGRVRVTVPAGGEDLRLGLVDPQGRRFDLVRVEMRWDFTEVRTRVWPAGETHDSVPLPAGEYRVVDTTGRRGIDEPITIRDGETTALELR